MTYFKRRCIKQNLISLIFCYKVILRRKRIKKKKKEQKKKGGREEESVLYIQVHC